MALAYRCDRCKQYHEGEPAGFSKLSVRRHEKDFDQIYSLALCIRCLNEGRSFLECPAWALPLNPPPSPLPLNSFIKRL